MNKLYFSNSDISDIANIAHKAIETGKPGAAESTLASLKRLMQDPSRDVEDIIYLVDCVMSIQAKLDDLGKLGNLEHDNNVLAYQNINLQIKVKRLEKQLQRENDDLQEQLKDMKDGYERRGRLYYGMMHKRDNLRDEIVKLEEQNRYLDQRLDLANQYLDKMYE